MAFRISNFAAALLAGCGVLCSSPPAQAAEGKAKTVRVTYPVADLVVPVSETDVQVALEVRLVSISEACCERLGLDFKIQLPSANGAVQLEGPGAATTRQGEAVRTENIGLTFLNPIQAAQLMEAVQGDRHSNTLQAPRLTLLNGQQGNLEVMDSNFFLTKYVEMRQGKQTFLVPNQEPFKTGMCWTARPVVSADRRFVRLDLKLTQTDLASPNVPLIPVQIPVPAGVECVDAVKTASGSRVLTTFLQQPQFKTQTLATMFTIPDGGTAVFCGLKRVTQSRHEVATPVLSKIPYLDRCFRSVGYGRETETLLVLVTPRIIINEENQETFGKAVPAMRPPCLDTAKQMPQPSPSAGLTPVGWQSAPVSIQEPQNLPSYPQAPSRPAVVRCEPAPAAVLAQLLHAYDEACAAGRVSEARRLGRAALILDPTCFQKR